MKHTLAMIAASAVMILLPTGAASAEDVLPLPFHIDISSVRAYASTESMTIYLVWDSHVFVIAFDLPVSQADSLTIEAGTDSCSVTQYFGEGIALYVLPAGPAVPFPPDFHHWSRDVIGGAVTVSNVPAGGEPEFGRLITITLEGIDFGDGETHSFGPVEAATSVYPP